MKAFLLVEGCWTVGIFDKKKVTEKERVGW